MTGEAPRTTKYVTATLKLTFHGDYIEKDDVVAQAEAWMDAGFNDRDNLKSWNLDVTEVREVAGDPEGYDA